ncbi:hypothetical protein MRX96_011758 [Rhipicephalus microplus]
MFTPLLTFQIVACWVADTVGLGDCAWSPPGDLPVPIAPSSHLDQPRISSPIVSPLIPARACSYAWQRFSSSTSPTTWGQCGLHNLHNITKSSGHDTGWRKMFTPLLTFQIVACWVADTVGLGDCAWSPPGDLPVPIAPSSHLDQPRISSPIVSPLIPARACSYAWQRFSSSTSPTTWGQCGLHNLHNITKSSGHDTGWRKMFTPLLTFQIVACWVADTVGLGDCAWSPPGDLPVPIAPSSHLDQPRISSPIVSPLIPTRACSYAWQRFSSSTSPTTTSAIAQPCKRTGQTPDPSHTPSKLPDQRVGEPDCGDTNEPTTNDDASAIVGLDEKVYDWSGMKDDNFKMRVARFNCDCALRSSVSGMRGSFFTTRHVHRVAVEMHVVVSSSRRPRRPEQEAVSCTPAVASKDE